MCKCWTKQNQHVSYATALQIDHTANCEKDKAPKAQNPRPKPHHEISPCCSGPLSPWIGCTAPGRSRSIEVVVTATAMTFFPSLFPEQRQCTLHVSSTWTLVKASRCAKAPKVSIFEMCATQAWYGSVCLPRRSYRACGFIVA